VNRRVLIPVLAVALCASLVPAATAKKGGGNKAFEEQKVVGAAIPPDPATAASTPLISEITVPKKFKKKVVGDVNVTGFQTTGTAAGSADDLVVYLTSPKGRTVVLLSGIGAQSIGPLTLDDDTSVQICNVAPPMAPPCPGGTRAGASLFQPFAGTANLLNTFGGLSPGGPLSAFDGVKMRGTWRLNVSDQDEAAANSTLNQWGLRIKPAKPVTE
jgi:Proprotein convertase P-domain